mgnify:CR=1 FL=1
MTDTIITSKIESVVSIKEVQTAYGLILYHNLEMENGDKISIGKKKEQQLGWELTYEITGDGQQEYDTARSVQKDGGNYTPNSTSNSTSNSTPNNTSNKTKKGDVQELIIRQSSLKAAVDYCDNDKCSPEEICETAEIFVNWVMKKEL